MSGYIYNSRDTFLARCWWQGAGHRIQPQAWDDSKRHLAAIWIETGSRGNQGHYDEYLMSEENGVLEKRPDPIDFLSPDQQYYDLFWFGAYTKGSVRPGERRYYEIRPANRVWTIARWAVDCSSFSGYVGMWKAEEEQGAPRKPEGARLWTIEGLAAALQPGTRQFNLQFVTPTGKTIRRHKIYGNRFFKTDDGEQGLIALEVLSIPHQLGEI